MIGGNLVRQTWAVVIDGYRELNAKKLFWITMLLSGLVVAGFGITSVKQGGIGVLWYTIPVDLPPGITSDLWYNFLFVTFGVQLWLTWIAAVLGLVTTAGIIPDFVSGGSVELSLSKPIGRVRLFLTKYFVGLLFVTLQVAVFSVGCLLVFGLRGGTWDPRLLLAIPIVVCFFSYLYCVCALVGLITRSTITSLLVTILLWFVIFVVNAAEGVLFAQRAAAEARAESNQRIAETITQTTREQFIAAQRALAEGDDPDDGIPEPTDEQLRAQNPFIQQRRDAAAESAKVAESLGPWYEGVRIAELVLPKTGDTTELLNRYLPSLAETFLPDDEDTQFDVPEDASDFNERELRAAAERAGQRAVIEEAKSRPVWSIIGTSLAFEAVVLAIACLIFRRRDF